MSEYKITLPPMGEGIIEATITRWVKNEGDFINEDEIIVEIATDKVDSDVPTPRAGKLIKKLKDVNEVCDIGEAFAILEVEDDSSSNSNNISSNTLIESSEEEIIAQLESPLVHNTSSIENTEKKKDNYYSPLVRAICEQENISESERQSIVGTGLNGRITKEDILTYLKNRSEISSTEKVSIIESKIISRDCETPSDSLINDLSTKTIVSSSESDEIFEMDRMRKLIAENMLRSKQIAPHVTSFVETDVTNIVLWRNKFKDLFYKKEGEKLTYTPIFIQAVVKAIKDFPMINISVKGSTIIKKKNINIGMATALPNGNLIVPVIKNADQLSLSGLARKINDLANRARTNKLNPEDTQGGTYTVSNIGGFGNIAGTPIINQPQVAILAIGSIVKKPAVIEAPQGDLIGIRHKMILSHTFDHRVVDGALGGMFIKRISDYLEDFDLNTEI
ncbi:2-oxo acid dehydrogenase subunit E2 [Apibacter muscae]|uniref:dihydrolipoamide acetyltransferase family protein n=1 Tax=Apibacter muscae TaxID=2509004 RepID=UPI0011AC080B|nr:dihydrolipoamide acetyltransferase family protein [Apibacter muscae]TWP22945.1 2-oxo acid dehydrogenase subunit E2 [Apibacter muscae]